MDATANAYSMKIEGMSGDACVRKVKSALDSCNGVTTDSVIVGGAKIHCDSQAKSDAARDAVNAAGYKATKPSPIDTDSPASADTSEPGDDYNTNSNYADGGKASTSLYGNPSNPENSREVGKIQTPGFDPRGMKPSLTSNPD